MNGINLSRNPKFFTPVKNLKMKASSLGNTEPQIELLNYGIEPEPQRSCLPLTVTPDSLHSLVGPDPFQQMQRIGLSVLSYLSRCAYLALFMTDLRLFLNTDKS